MLIGRQSLSTYSITNDLSIQIVEIPEPENSPECNFCGQGYHWNETWPSALALSRYLANEFPLERLKGCKALVIGCGVGLEGLALAKMGATVSFLDHIPEALQLVSRNCLINGIESFQTICCCWKDSDKIQNIGKYDLVIGSDILYFFFYYLYRDEYIWMESLLKATLKTKGLALFSDPMRIDKTDLSNGLNKNNFRVNSVDPRWGTKDQRILIYCVERL